MPAMPGPGFPVLAVGLGYGRGEVRELVFKSETDLLSRLDWPLQGVISAELRFGFHLDETWFLSLDASLPVPGKSGVMQDYDWTDNSGSPTHFSEHDNILDLAWRAGALCGYRIPGGGSFSLVLLAGVTVQHLAFTARDGYAEYPPGSTPVQFDGPVITYDITLLGFELGVAAEWVLDSRWALLGCLRVSPWAAFGWAHDEHLLRSLEFFDEPRGGFSGNACGAVRLSLTSSIFIEGGVEYGRLFDTIGPSRQLDLASGLYSDLGDSGGVAIDRLTGYLLVEWAFP